MNRQKLLNAVESIATGMDYKFYSSDENYPTTQIKEYPSAWLLPPQFHSIEGRHHGTETYSLTLHLLSDAAKLSPVERNQTRTLLEEDMLQIFTSLTDKEFVSEVENLKIRYSLNNVERHGEVVATATAEVITFF
jgi:hypothetical protein